MGPDVVRAAISFLEGETHSVSSWGREKGWVNYRDMKLKVKFTKLMSPDPNFDLISDPDVEPPK